MYSLFSKDTYSSSPSSQLPHSSFLEGNKGDTLLVSTPRGTPGEGIGKPGVSSKGETNRPEGGCRFSPGEGRRLLPGTTRVRECE